MWLKCSLCSKNCFFFLTPGYFFELPITWTSDNSNVFWFPLKVRVIGSWLYIKIWLTTGNPNNSLFCTQFSPLSTRNCIWGLCNLNIVWGSILPDTAWKHGLLQAPCWHSQLLHSNLLVTSKNLSKPLQVLLEWTHCLLYCMAKFNDNHKNIEEIHNVTYKRLAFHQTKWGRLSSKNFLILLHCWVNLINSVHQTKFFNMQVNNKIEQYLESKEVFCVISSKHKFSAHIGVIKKYGDLVSKSFERVEADWSPQNEDTKYELQSQSPNNRAPLNLKR